MNEIFWNSRKDFIGLSTDTKETENMSDGNTFYEVDTSDFYIFYKGEWYKQGAETEQTAESEQASEGGE